MPNETGQAAEAPDATATAVAEPTQGTGDSEVTPELQSKFDQVFGGSDGESPTRTADPHADTEEAESLASLDGSTWEDTGSENSDLIGDTDEPAEDGAGEAEADTGEGTADDSEVGEDAGEATLDDTLRHAAKRTGWSDEEIEGFYEQNPELALKTFERMRDSSNELTRQFAELGQARKGLKDGDGGQAPGDAQASDDGDGEKPDPHTVTAGDLLANAFGDRLDTVRSEYGEDFYEEILTPLAEAIAAPLAEAYGFVSEQREAALNREVDQFFNGLPESRRELYGQGAKVSGEEHVKARQEVAELADQIRAGAAVQGLDLSVTDALERADALYAQDHIRSSERKKLTDQVARRSGRRTQRPTQRRRTRGAGAERSTEAAMEAYETRAAELGLDV